jgi:hypothetical protein
MEKGTVGIVLEPFVYFLVPQHTLPLLHRRQFSGSGSGDEGVQIPHLNVHNLQE